MADARQRFKLYAATDGPDKPHKHRDRVGSEMDVLVFTVMARLVRATHASTVTRPVARTSRAMTVLEVSLPPVGPYPDAYAVNPPVKPGEGHDEQAKRRTRVAHAAIRRSA